MEEVCTKLTNSTTVAGTRIPPSEPHFFRPIIPGFHQHLFIPISFFKYLDGQKCENALLRSGRGKLWPVKINGQRLEDGWTDFAQDHDLHVGDFLVFRHEGDMVFHVMVFDPSFCEREYPPLDIIEVDPKEEKETSMAEYRKDFNESEEILKNKEAMTRPPQAKPTFFTLRHPYFASTVKPHNVIKNSILVKWSYNRRCEMILKDQKQRSWVVKLSHLSSGSVYIGCGWRDFRIANGLKKGDAFIFELIEKGEKPVMKFHGLATLGHRYFFATVKPYYLKKSQMNIPMYFARSNGLSNKCCEMILRDQKGILWPVSLTHEKSSGKVYIRRGWSKFAVANNLKVGDVLMLELVWGGKKLIMNFSALPPEEELGYHGEYLVELGGEIYMDIQCLYDTAITDIPLLKTWGFVVYKLDMCTEKWEEVESLDNWSLFLGYDYSFSIRASD